MLAQKSLCRLRRDVEKVTMLRTGGFLQPVRNFA